MGLLPLEQVEAMEGLVERKMAEREMGTLADWYAPGADGRAAAGYPGCRLSEPRGIREGGSLCSFRACWLGLVCQGWLDWE